MNTESLFDFIILLNIFKKVLFPSPDFPYIPIFLPLDNSIDNLSKTILSV